MAVTINKKEIRAASSKIEEVIRVTVSFSATNDIHVVHHGTDNLGGRSVKLLSSSGKIIPDKDRFEIQHVNAATTSIKNLTTIPQPEITIVVVVPET